MTEADYDGECFCGSVRFRVSGPVRNLCYCHCESCRRASGAPFVAWGTFARENFVLLHGKPAEYRSSPPVTRGFCAACGTTLTYCHDGRPGDIDVTLVTLDDPGEFVPKFHIWVQDKLPYIDIGDGLPAYESVPGH